MKSIDDVIKMTEICNKRIMAHCYDCPYDGEPCNNGEDVADTLHYLKEYKAQQEKPLLNRLTAVLREVRGEK